MQGQCLLGIFYAQYTFKMCYKDTTSVNTHFCRKLNKTEIHAFSHATWVTISFSLPWLHQFRAKLYQSLHNLRQFDYFIFKSVIYHITITEKDTTTDVMLNLKGFASIEGHFEV